ncbi:MAG: CaiB/BaiF CoA-transferase family protein [Woeseia sp.]
MAGTKVIEAGGIGPVPFCGMLLADLGAEVILIERRGLDTGSPQERGGTRNSEIVHRGKKSIGIDLKTPRGADAALQIIAQADAVIEGFRPGVMERLGLGPEPSLALNPRLVYGRLSGWGQHGPLSATAGHDINYIALAGALFHGGPADRPPTAPPTLVGDIGGGAMLLAIGLLAALLHARQSGKGQVIDAAISDGAALATALLVGLQQQGLWADARQSNFLDGGAPWYDSYQCADDNYITVGALEPLFYRELLQKCGLAEDALFQSQFDMQTWPQQKMVLARLFRTRSRAEWCDIFEASDACFAPVLNLSEAREHPHNRVRQTFVKVDEVSQPAPAPRFSVTPGKIGRGPPAHGAHTVEVLESMGFSASDIAGLRESAAI